MVTYSPDSFIQQQNTCIAILDLVRGSWVSQGVTSAQARQPHADFIFSYLGLPTNFSSWEIKLLGEGTKLYLMLTYMLSCSYQAPILKPSFKEQNSARTLLADINCTSVALTKR